MVLVYLQFHFYLLIYLYFQSENNGEYLIRKVDINNRGFIIPLENDLEVVKAINLLINKEELNLN